MRLAARRRPRERKDVNIVRRTVMMYLYSLGLTHYELADIFEVSESRVTQILNTSCNYTPNPFHSWRHNR